VSYLRRASPLHSARPGVAAAYCGALVVAAFLTGHPLVLAALALAVLGAGAAARVGGRVARSLYLSLPMAIPIVAVNALVTREGLTVLARLGDGGPLGQLDITLESIAYGARQALVLVVVIEVAALASATIDPDEVLRSLRRASFRSALTATVATRMVPLLALDARRIAEAQRCRPRPSPRLAVARALAANALDRSLEVAATLEVRGYGCGRRPPRRRRPFSRHDIAFGLAAAAVAAAAAWQSPFSFYPRIHGSFAAVPALHAALLALVVLAPFAQRRGIGS
jgi:energy-coupling factor transport system permease protein